MAMTKREIFARNLQKAIEGSYLNQSQIAKMCGISRGSCSDWCSGKTYPRPEKMELLCNALGVTEYDLTHDFEGEDVKAYMNREVADIAEELRENPDARALYVAITKLSDENKKALKQIVLSLAEQH